MTGDAKYTDDYNFPDMLYGATLRAAYPPRDGRTMLPFRRVFAVAEKQR